MAKKLLSTGDVSRRTGFSQQKVRDLIAAGRLPAINTSTGTRPRWEVPEDVLEEFLTPRACSVREATTRARTRRQCIDAAVAKVF